jgi:hypothetical protein
MNLAIAFAQVLHDFGIDHQILSVTCNNTSNNDTMINEMDTMLTGFSSVNRTSCFAHILNLVPKSLLKQLDVKQDEKMDGDLNDNKQMLLAIAGDVEEEEQIMAQENDTEDGDTEDDDSLEGWVDEVEALTDEERENLQESIWPIKRMLVKVMKVWSVLTCMA